MKTEDLVLHKTCSACPEQYDVLADGVKVGYIRLRNGVFSVEAGARTVFSRQFGSTIHGSPMEPEETRLPNHRSDGLFDHDEVRSAYLDLALRKIAEASHR